MKTHKFNVHQAVTDQVLEAMNASDGKVDLPWRKKGLTRPVNAVSGKPYRGANVVPLWITAERCGYTSNQWATFRQWKQLGGHVRKGEHSTLIMFYKPMQKTIENDDGEEETRKWLMARAYRVFNRNQVDGLEPARPLENRVAEISEIEAFISNTKAEIRIGGDTACYRPMADRIDMPDRHLFVGTSTSDPTLAWYAVLLHELTHWTGAKHRLNRSGGQRFGDREYAFEELVAELGSAFLCADLGLSVEPREDHAHYLKHWIRLLEDDNKAFIQAASRAQAASDFLFSLQENKESLQAA